MRRAQLIKSAKSLAQSIVEMNLLTRTQKGVKANQSSEENFWVWGATVIFHEGMYYYLGNKWDDTDGFSGWVYYNKVCVASSPNRLGPFENLTEITELKTQSWSADMTSNPQIFKWGGKFYLFYIGTNYEEVTYPVVDSEARLNEQIGVAVADHPSGPYTPSDNNPIIGPRAGKWDSELVNNPSVFQSKDGKLRMVYKGVDSDNVLKMGMATAMHPEGPWYGRTDEPNFALEGQAEDPTVWQEQGKWYAIAKAMDSSLTGIEHGDGMMFVSDDGVTFEYAENIKAWSRTIEWTDGTSVKYPSVERPFVLVEDGKATAFYTAVQEVGGTGSFNIGRELSEL